MLTASSERALILRHVEDLSYARLGRMNLHRLTDMVEIALCAEIRGFFHGLLTLPIYAMNDT